LKKVWDNYDCYCYSAVENRINKIRDIYHDKVFHTSQTLAEVRDFVDGKIMHENMAEDYLAFLKTILGDNLSVLNSEDAVDKDDYFYNLFGIDKAEYALAQAWYSTLTDQQKRYMKLLEPKGPYC